MENQISPQKITLTLTDRHGTSYGDPILAPKPDPKESQNHPKSSSDDVKNEKNACVDFLQPCLAKSLFLKSNEAKLEPERRQEWIFVAIEKDDERAMQFQELLGNIFAPETSGGGALIPTLGPGVGPHLYIDEHT